MTTRFASGSSEWVDRVGAALSLSCAVHCAIAPLLIAALPLAAASWLFDESIEAAFVCGSVATALISLGMGVRVHRRRRVFVLLGVAVLLIAAGRCAGDRLAELVLVGGGAGVLAAAHVVNFHLCRRCRGCAHEHGRETLQSGERVLDHRRSV
jgi:hypothetical protein